MRFTYILWLANKNLLARKLRTVLTALGISIGVSSVLFLTSLSNGLEHLTISKIQEGESAQLMTVSSTSYAKNSLLNEDLMNTLRTSSGVKAVEPENVTAGTLSTGKASVDTVIHVVQPSYFMTAFLSPEKGKLITDTTGILINEQAAKALSLDEKSIGNTLTLTMPPSIPLAAGQSSSFVYQGLVKDGSGAEAYVVRSAMDANAIQPYDFLHVQFETPSTDLIAAIRRNLETKGLQTDYVGDTTNQVSRLFSVLTAVLAVFGAVALLVSILGIMNTLTVNLLEKTKEIGFMKAMGVQERDIQVLLFTEAGILCLAGGTLGIVVASVVGYGLNAFLNYYAQHVGGQAAVFYQTPLLYFVYAYVFSFALGLITGIVPARRALALSPLEALRYE